MRLLFFAAMLFFAGGLFAAADISAYERERREAAKLLADDFAALNRGTRTLSEVGERVLEFAEADMPELRRRILLAGAIRLFTRAGETNRAAEADMRLKAMMPFVQSGSEAELYLGKYGSLEFVKCPTGTVDVAVHWRNGKTERVTLTRPYWIMKYPITRRESALFPPLDPPHEVVNSERFENYVCLNRSQSEGLCEYFTRHFNKYLPAGYVVRLPTLAEWEHAFHAGTRDRSSPFFDLLHIHMNDEVDRAVRYDYDRGEPQRKKAVNAWGIGDWCGQEKVYDTVDPDRLLKSESEGGDFYQVQGLPAFETSVDPCFRYDGTNRVTLIRMPFWARWKAARIGFNQDWCPIRLVIAPKID